MQDDTQKLSLILRELDSFDVHFWSRYKVLIADSNGDKPDNIAYPSPLRAIRQLTKALLEEQKSETPASVETKSGEPMVNYAHQHTPKGIRFCQYAKDPLPPWAVDVRHGDLP